MNIVSVLKILISKCKLPILGFIGITFAIFCVIIAHSSKKQETYIEPPTTTYADSIAGIGIVEPQSEFISISTELSGVLREMNVKVGDKVEKGDPLFSLDQRDIDSQIQILNASLGIANAQFLDASAQFSIVESIDDKRAVSKEDFYKRKYAQDIAEARVKEISAQLAQAQITKDRLITRAPIKGEILEVNIHPGEFASTGALATPLIVMGDIDVLYLRVEIDEENAVNINVNAPAKGMLRGASNEAIDLSFVRIEEYVRPKQNLAASAQRVDTRVMKVIYSIQKTKHRILVGQQMDVYIMQ